jgi:hypothetical protein
MKSLIAAGVLGASIICAALILQVKPVPEYSAICAHAAYLNYFGPDFAREHNKAFSWDELMDREDYYEMYVNCLGFSVKIGGSL